MPARRTGAYRRARNRDYELPVEAKERQIVYTAELLRFVKAQRRQAVPGERLPQWKELVELWNQCYPQHPFKGWRAMQSSHRQASVRVEAKKRK